MGLLYNNNPKETKYTQNIKLNGGEYFHLVFNIYLKGWWCFRRCLLDSCPSFPLDPSHVFLVQRRGQKRVQGERRKRRSKRLHGVQRPLPDLQTSWRWQKRKRKRKKRLWPRRPRDIPEGTVHWWGAKQWDQRRWRRPPWRWGRRRAGSNPVGRQRTPPHLLTTNRPPLMESLQPPAPHLLY